MKIPALLIFMAANSIAMDFTPPPSHKEPTWENMPRSPGNDDVASTIHRTHSVKEIHATIHNNTGKDLEINATVDEERDSETHHITRKTLIISNGCTAIITAMIGAGVAIALKLGDCK